jgi:hypothetical protein
MRARFLVFLATALVLLTACGGSGGGGEDESDGGAAVEAPAAAPSPAPAAASATKLNYQGTMSGKEQTTGGDPDGTGTFKVTIDKATNNLCYELAWQNLDEPNAAHIHIGDPNEAGKIMVDLNLAANGPKACLPVDATSVGHMTSGPKAHYSDLHNQSFPEGAIRGQLQS